MSTLSKFLSQFVVSGTDRSVSHKANDLPHIGRSACVVVYGFCLRSFFSLGMSAALAAGGHAGRQAGRHVVWPTSPRVTQ